MSDASPAVPAAEAPISPVSAVVGTFTNPSETFRRLVARPTWWLPFVLWAVLGLGSNSLVLRKVDWDGAAQDVMAQRSKSGRSIPPEAAPRIAGVMRIYTLVAVSLFIVAIPFLVALVLWGGTKAFGGVARYSTLLAVTTHANLPNVVGTIIAIPVFFSRDDNSLNLQRMYEVLKSNVAAFLPDGAGHALVALCSSLDIFMLTALSLAVLGMRRIPGLPKGAAVAIPVLFWAILVGIKVALAAMRG